MHKDGSYSKDKGLMVRNGEPIHSTLNQLERLRSIRILVREEEELCDTKWRKNLHIFIM